MSNANYPVNSAGSAAFAATVSACVFAFLVPICSADGVIEPAVVAVLVGIFAEMLRRHTVRKLVTSLNATDADALLDVYINGAQVGTIASIDAISLKLDALRDPRNYAAQFVNILGFAGRGTLAALIFTGREYQPPEDAHHSFTRDGSSRWLELVSEDLRASDESGSSR